MKKFKYIWIVYALMLLVTVMSASSFDFTDGLVNYYKLDSSSGSVAVDSLHNNNRSISNGVWDSNGFINNGLKFSSICGDGACLNLASSGLSSSVRFTHVFWIKTPSSKDSDNFWGQYSTSSSNINAFFGLGSDGYFKYHIRASGTWSVLNTGISYETDTWYMITITNPSSNNVVFYVNNQSYSNTFSGTTHLNTVVGLRDTKVVFDEVAVYDIAFSSSDVNDYFQFQKDAHECSQYPFICQINFSVSLEDKNTGLSIDDFSITVDSVSYSTTNGSITTHLLDNDTSLYDISFYNIGGGIGSETHFDFTVNNINVSNNYEGEAEQFVLNVSHFVTGEALNGSIYADPQVCIDPPCSLMFISNFTNGVYKGVLGEPSVKTRNVLLTINDYYNKTFNDLNLLNPLNTTMTPLYYLWSDSYTGIKNSSQIVQSGTATRTTTSYAVGRTYTNTGLYDYVHSVFFEHQISTTARESWAYVLITYNDSTTSQSDTFITSSTTPVLEEYLNPHPYKVIDKVEVFHRISSTTSTSTLRDLGLKTSFVRQLNYSVSVVCPTFISSSFNLLVNNLTHSFTPACNNETPVLIQGFNTHIEEGLINVSLALNNTNISKTSPPLYLVSDLNNPTINASMTLPEGFNNITSTLKLTCSDTMSPYALYNMTYKGVSLFKDNKTISTEQTNTSTVLHGNNIYIVSCSDLFGTTTQTITKNAYFKTINLIDEVDNTAFAVANLSSARLYYDDNSTFYDFKTANKNTVNFTSTNMTQLRLELGYPENRFITRWIDVALFSEINPLRICANKDNIIHYEQFITSSILKSVFLKNIYANCYVAGDRTRFAFKDGLILRAYTITGAYSLYTIEGLQQVLLASVDGAIQSDIFLDQLQFRRESFAVTILPDLISFNKVDVPVGALRIYYLNKNLDNYGLTINIKHGQTGELLFSESTFVNFNEASIVFNYATINNITDSTLLVLEVVKTNEAGQTTTLRRYFNTSGKTGQFRSEVVSFIAFFVLLFGFTFTSSQQTFGWFGMIIGILVFGFLSFAISAWYVIFLQALSASLIIYCVIMLSKDSAGGFFT